MAVRHLIIEINYAKADYVKGITPQPKEIICMDLDDARDALDALEKEEDIRAVTAVMIAIYMGRRRGEVAGLQWSDIDLECGEMEIKRSRSNVAGRGVIEKRPKSTASEQTSSMPPSLTEQLRKYKVWWDKYVENIGDRFDQSKPYLFLQANGKPLYPSTIYYWLKKIEGKYGLKDVHYHSLRHTNISVQYASNQIPSKAIAQRAGHSDDKVTKKRYQEIFKKDDQRIADIVDGIFQRKREAQN